MSNLIIFDQAQIKKARHVFWQFWDDDWYKTFDALQNQLRPGFEKDFEKSVRLHCSGKSAHERERKLRRDYHATSVGFRAEEEAMLILVGNELLKLQGEGK